MAKSGGMSMIFTSKRLNNRIIDLNDCLVNEYCKYTELRDNNFFIVIKSKYGRIPSEDEVSREELSRLCNEILLSELKAMALLPKALEKVEELTKASRNNEAIECQL